MAERLIHELRRKYPGLAKNRDKGWALASIKLFCIECMGGQIAAVGQCAVVDCPLFLLRFGKGPRTRGGLPQKPGMEAPNRHQEPGKSRGKGVAPPKIGRLRNAKNATRRGAR